MADQNNNQNPNDQVEQQVSLGTIPDPIEPKPDAQTSAVDGNNPQDDQPVFDIEEYMMRLLLLKKASENDELKALHEALLVEAEAKNFDPVSYVMGTMQIEQASHIELIYPDVYRQIHQEIATQSGDMAWQHKIRDDAGFTPQEWTTLSADQINSLALKQKYDDAFPDNGPGSELSLGEKLKPYKRAMLQAATSPEVAKVMNVIGWSMAIATGGVAVKLGILAGKQAVIRLCENPSVISFAASTKKNVVEFLVSKGFPMKKVTEAKDALVEKTRPITSSKLFKITAGVAATVAAAVILNEVFSEEIASFKNTLHANVLDPLQHNVIEPTKEWAHLVNERGIQPALTDLHDGKILPTPVIDALKEHVAEPVVAVAGAWTPEWVANAASSGVWVANEYLIAPVAEHVVDPMIAHLSGDEATPNALNSGEVVAELPSQSDSATAMTSPASADPLKIPEVEHQVTETPAQTGPGAAQTHGSSAIEAGDSAMPAVSQDSLHSFTNPASVELPHSHTVVRNETLSHIAVDLLKASGVEVTQSNIQATWEAIYEGNKDVLAKGPHFILPGQELKIDPSMIKGLGVPAPTAGVEVSLPAQTVATVAPEAPVQHPVLPDRADTMACKPDVVTPIPGREAMDRLFSSTNHEDLVKYGGVTPADEIAKDLVDHSVGKPAVEIPPGSLNTKVDVSVLTSGNGLEAKKGWGEALKQLQDMKVSERGVDTSGLER